MQRLGDYFPKAAVPVKAGPHTAEQVCRELIEWADDPEIRDRKILNEIIEKARVVLRK